MNLNNNLKKLLNGIEVKETKKNGHDCKGLFFRGYSSTHYDNDGKIERREGFRLLKKKSCDGFECCGSYDGNVSKMRCDWWMLEEMRESLECEIVIIPGIEDKAIYSVKVVNETFDFESGYCDGYELEFYKIEEMKDGTYNV